MAPAGFHIALLTNLQAGKGNAVQIAKRISQVLSARGIAYELFSDNWPENFLLFSDAWVVGGDGTLNYFINRYPDIMIPLSIFKGGSGNDFASFLYGTLSPEMQVEYVLKTKPRPVDAAVCNNRIFLNVTGIGLTEWFLKI